MDKFLGPGIFQGPGLCSIPKPAQHQGLEHLDAAVAREVRILEKMSAVLRKSLLGDANSPASLPPIVRAMLDDASQMGILADNSDFLCGPSPQPQQGTSRLTDQNT